MEFFKLLNKWNIAAYSYDCHGHGTAEPIDPDLRFYIDSYKDMVDDMEDFIN